MTTDHTAAAERHRDGATAASASGAGARAQVAALLSISHEIAALVEELRDEHHRIDMPADPWTPAHPAELDVCPHDETRLNPDGSETCLACDQWSRYGWHIDTSPAAEQDPLELDGDPTVESVRPDLTPYGRRGYASDIRHTPDPYSGAEA